MIFEVKMETIQDVFADYDFWIVEIYNLLKFAMEMTSLRDNSVSGYCP